VAGITFPNIPAGPGVLVPGFYADFDPSRAGYGTATLRGLVIGNTVASVAATPQYISNADAADALFGSKSIIARMVRSFRAVDSFGELYALGLADHASGVAASGSLVFTGPASAAGTLALYIAGQPLPIPVTSGMTASQLASAVNTAINAATTLPVTSTVSTGTVTVTAVNKGTQGNDIDLRLNYQGVRGGEVTPAGIACSITAMASGATDPSLSTLDAILGDELYDFIAVPWSTTTQLDAIASLLATSTGRWSWTRGAFGHCYAWKRDTSANLLTAGAARNDEHVTLAGIYDSPTPPWEAAATLAATAAVSVRAHPARQLTTLALPGVKAPPPASRFSISTRQSLLASGIATTTADADGTVRIERAVTTYQKNASGNVDRSYLDSTTMHLLAAVIRRLKTSTSSRFARYMLANDGTAVGAGQPVVTPAIYKGYLVAEYAAMEADAWVQAASAQSFADATVVQRDANDPNRLNVLFVPTLMSNLRVLALLAQFRLQ
jgi:phage tail sheath gpL-like